MRTDRLPSRQTPKRDILWVMETAVIQFLKSFSKADDGAVTVDWVVLTAAVVGMAFLSYVELQNNTDQVLTSTGEALLTAQDYLE